ncbi:hypothetical protein [Streptomyces sp. NPDC029554]|uniref:hypothetical protein n=1 Tax=Streptomyces sp. NPDC029554 TaxID=3155126 RepID=UPI0033EE5352
MPPDLERLLTLRVWHAMWLVRIDHKIAELQKREAERENGRRVRPAKPEWIVQLSIGTGRPPVQVSAGDCYKCGRGGCPLCTWCMEPVQQKWGPGVRYVSTRS